MNCVVCDTDVVSYIFENHPFGSPYQRDLAGRMALISFMTIAEIERRALQYHWGDRRIRVLRAYLSRFTVVPSSPDLCRKWAQVMVSAQDAGRRIESADAWIAATALLHDATLLTNNRADYLGVNGLTLISHAP